MLRVIHSIPEECPDCGAENLSGEQMLLFSEGNTVLCNACGILMVLHEDDVEAEEEAERERQADFELSASFLSCPHCCTVNEIQVEGGEEWCGGCGLDPNRTEVPVEELAHLWKEGSGIRATMERGVPRAGMARMYRFLISCCGPHCSFAEACPQATGNYAKCFREEVVESDDPDLLHIEGDEVGKGKRKRSRKERKQEKARIRKEKERAVLACAGSGWYDKRYCNETEDPQESAHTGSGSGT